MDLLKLWWITKRTSDLLMPTPMGALSFWRNHKQHSLDQHVPMMYILSSRRVSYKQDWVKKRCSRMYSWAAVSIISATMWQQDGAHPCQRLLWQQWPVLPLQIWFKWVCQSSMHIENLYIKTRSVSLECICILSYWCLVRKGDMTCRADGQANCLRKN